MHVDICVYNYVFVKFRLLCLSAYASADRNAILMCIPIDAQRRGTKFMTLWILTAPTLLFASAIVATVAEQIPLFQKKSLLPEEWEVST